MKRYQIIRKAKDDTFPKWEFVAHGATYTAESAAVMVALIKSHGSHHVRLLLV